MSSPIFIDYLSIGDSSGLNNAIGLSEIDSCNCDVLVFDTISVCDTLISFKWEYSYHIRKLF